MLKVLLLLVSLWGGMSEASSWHHPDDGSWCSLGDDFALCCASSTGRQSPVDIPTNADGFAVVQADDVEDLDEKISGYDVDGAGYITNNGHSAQWNWDDDDNAAPVFSLGGSQFEFAQLHFHWGSDDSLGSEHTVDGRRFPLEMHMVHWNNSYDSLGTAASSEGGLAVVGFLFDVVDEYEKDFSELDNVINALPDITAYSSSVDLNLNLRNFFREVEDTTKFVTYSGSLTTPFCYESVYWTVITAPLQVTSQQMEAFRTLLDEDSEVIEDNFRNVQPLNGRVVTRNWAVDDQGYGSPAKAYMAKASQAYAVKAPKAYTAKAPKKAQPRSSYY